jgi:hypothetical protein
MDWPWLLAVAVAVMALVTAAWVAYRVAWRRAVAGGYWVQVTPPRVVDTARAGHVWRLLAGLARRAGAGRRVVRPPLAFEVYAAGGRLVAGLWLPGWVPWRAVVAEVGRAWPGAAVERRDPPGLPASWPVAGFGLRAVRSDTGPLTDDVRLPSKPAAGLGSDGDPLEPVLSALGSPDGPALLQVLVRPAPARAIRALRHAARHPVTRPRGGSGPAAVALAAVRLLLDAVTELLSTGRPATGRGELHRPAADPLAAAVMREAAGKLDARPHLVAAIRVGAGRSRRSIAVSDAEAITGGYVYASGVLMPVRIRRAAVVLGERRVRRQEWLLCTAAELGVLAHLPLDPARHAFDTAALQRRPPATARRAAPERVTGRAPGWADTGWTPARRTGHDR